MKSNRRLLMDSVLEHNYCLLNVFVQKKKKQQKQHSNVEKIGLKNRKPLSFHFKNNFEKNHAL